jgi:hypothetical protein
MMVPNGQRTAAKRFTKRRNLKKTSNIGAAGSVRLHDINRVSRHY